MNSIKRWLRVLFTPSIWFCDGAYSEPFDKYINQLMVNNKFVYINGYRASLGNLRFYIKNSPYPCMTYQGVRPSKATILEAYDKYIKEIVCQL